MRNASVFQSLIFVPETVAGTDPGSGYLQAAALMGYASPVMSSRPVRASGGRDPVGVIQGKERSNWPLEGIANFHDLFHLLSAHLGEPATDAAGTRVWTPNPFSPEDLETLTLYQGSEAAAKTANYGFMPDFRLRATLDEVNVTAAIHARSLDKTGVSLPSYAPLPEVSLQPTEWTLWFGSAMSGGDLTEFGADEGVLEYEFGNANSLKGQNFADGSRTFADVVHRANDKRVQVVMEDNSQAASFLDDLRAATLGLMRFRCPGPAIGSASLYNFQITCPFMFLSEDDGNRDDLAGATFNLQPMWHPDYLTTGGALEIQCVIDESAE